ncbi:hypothetical protein EVU96_00005 [Bacillus infantis]|uniref:hypothetical protein n=1 Tax=Bacillus infantis TaxID=324767 RepID=UPI00101B740E|nr:hypothetical protein [Bacillus infantis]RYI32027.1 hypothetical protein EVU96_00005 [Bacillus infantis]
MALDKIQKQMLASDVQEKIDKVPEISDKIGNLLDKNTQIDAQLAERPTHQEIGLNPPKIVTLIGCQDDESPTVSNCSWMPDAVNFKYGDRGTKISFVGAVTATVKYDPLSVDDPVKFSPASAVGLWIYVKDPALISGFTIEIYLTDTGSQKWVRTAQNFTVGWNLFRWPSTTGGIGNWNEAYAIRIIAVTTGATDVTVGHIWMECPEKAQILFIEDGGYTTFLDNGYPDLKQRNIPVTWSIDPAKLGAEGRITELQVLSLAKENHNDINYHGFDGTPTSTMTEAQIRMDCIKSIKWLQHRGIYEGNLWRSAWVQNTAQNAQAAKSLMLAYATPKNSSGLTCFPPQDRWDIARTSVHGSTQETIDLHFANLKKTHQLLVIYTHGINDAGGNDATNAQWDYFISKIDQGINEGWLEGVTFPQLLMANGVKLKPTSEDWVKKIFDI